MSVLDHLGERRKRDTKFLLFARLCADTCARDKDSESAAALIVLVGDIEDAMRVRSCTLEDIQRAIQQAYPLPGSSVIDALPSEATRPARPSRMPKVWP
jgi:hypothetical protein